MLFQLERHGIWDGLAAVEILQNHNDIDCEASISKELNMMATYQRYVVLTPLGVCRRVLGVHDRDTVYNLDKKNRTSVTFFP